MFSKNKERIRTLEHNLDCWKQAYSRLYERAFAYVLEANGPQPNSLRLYSYFLDLASELGVDPRIIRLDVIEKEEQR